jgi:hypothetical protein
MNAKRFRVVAASVASVAVGLGLVIPFGQQIQISNTAAAPEPANAAADSADLGASLSEVNPALNVASKVSALTQLPALSGENLSEAQAQMSELNYGSTQINLTSVRRTDSGMLLAKRGKDVCLYGRFAASCILAFRDGGIHPYIQVERKWDSEDAPFVVKVDGVAIDGAKTVEFFFQDGKTTSAQVVDNVFQLTIGGEGPNDIVGYAVDGARYQWPQSSSSKVNRTFEK